MSWWEGIDWGGLVKDIGIPLAKTALPLFAGWRAGEEKAKGFHAPTAGRTVPFGAYGKIPKWARKSLRGMIRQEPTGLDPRFLAGMREPDWWRLRDIGYGTPDYDLMEEEERERLGELYSPEAYRDLAEGAFDVIREKLPQAEIGRHGRAQQYVAEQMEDQMRRAFIMPKIEAERKLAGDIEGMRVKGEQLSMQAMDAYNKGALSWSALQQKLAQADAMTRLAQEQLRQKAMGMYLGLYKQQPGQVGGVPEYEEPGGFWTAMSGLPKEWAGGLGGLYGGLKGLLGGLGGDTYGAYDPWASAQFGDYFSPGYGAGYGGGLGLEE